jgi:hypothetical protein
MSRPRGATPSPRHRLAAAAPHVATTPTPPSFLWLPPKLSMWANDRFGDCTVAEEAFAKGATTGIFIPDETVIAWAEANGAINGDTLIDVLDKMQTGGFVVGATTYDDGAPLAVDWTSAATLQNAISHGPVKIGVAADQLDTTVEEQGNTWLAMGFKKDENLDHCVSLCGYGAIAWLADQLGAKFTGEIADAPAYALFTWGSIGIIDTPSLLAITGEAWLRQPTSITNPNPQP